MGSHLPRARVRPARLARALVLLAALAAIAALAACGPTKTGAGDDVAGDDDPLPPDAPTIDGPDPDPIDATPIDANMGYPDAEPYSDGGACNDWMCTNPVDDGCDLGGPDVCGDGLDNNCNGMVDEGCFCQPGAVQSCFLGQPGRRGVGSCVDGQQTCVGSGEFTYWGPCTGGITPSYEACDSQDNDCNGCADDNPACCQVLLNCPGPGDLPDGAPFQPYVIDGTQFYGGAVQSWQWTISGGPCDQMFVMNGQNPSYTTMGATTSQFTFRPTLSGDYTITVTIVTAEGETLMCTFIIHVAGPGMRVELCWNTTGQTDIDLHLHRPGTTSPWFTTQLNNSVVNMDDCYYRNCKAGSSPAVNWGYANSPLIECSGGPEGAQWTLLGYCRNPRLDVDNIVTVGRPENINVDVPENGTYRVMVHFYSGSATTYPMVNVYCGGHLLGSYGRAPDLVTNFSPAGGFGNGAMWRVVDVTPTVVNGVTTGCALQPLHPPGQTSGYYVTVNNRVY